MAFTVQNWHDLITLLEQHPEWKAELRRMVLTDELLRLPELVKGLAERQAAAEQEIHDLRKIVTELAKRQAETEREIRELRQIVAQLAERQTHTEELLQQLIAQVQEIVRIQSAMQSDLRKLKGASKEMFYLTKAVAVFGLWVRKGRDGSAAVMDAISDALDQDIISRSEALELRATDLFWMGERKGNTLLVVGEISWTVSYSDIQRAVERANIARKLGFWALPFVGGEIWNDQQDAQKRYVICAIDGTIIPDDWDAFVAQWQP